MIHRIKVFNKCAETMEDGTRLANMSWRIWNRETLCCDYRPQYTDATIVPPLSTSVDSAISNDPSEVTSSKRLLSRDPSIFGGHSTARSLLSLSLTRSMEKNITSQGLQKMVHTIQDRKILGPLPSSIANAVPDIPTSPQTTGNPRATSSITSLHSSSSSASTAPRSSPDSQRSANRTDESFTSAELHTSHSVQRGFSAGQASSYRSDAHLAPAPISTRSISHTKPDDGKKNLGFSVGPSSGEDESSFEDPKLHAPKQGFTNKALKPVLPNKKQTSFRDEVKSRLMAHKPSHEEDVFEDSDEESSGPESAIEDDDEDGSDWEDDGSELAEPPADEKTVFQRVDSKPNLVSRRSLLTSQLASESERAAEFARMALNSAPAFHRSRTSGPSGLKLEVSQDDPSSHFLSQHRESRPIVRTSSTIAGLHPPTLSPRSTRRNMLAQELTETLRKDLLHERQQQGVGRRTNIQRSHTSADLSRTENPESSFSRVLFAGFGTGDYHATGW